MRPLAISLTFATFLTNFAATAGQSYRYVFSGTVTRIFDDQGGIASTVGVAVGDPVSATFDVRFDTLGYVIRRDGSLEVFEDPGTMTTLPTWSFQSNLVNATLLPILSGGFYNGPGDAKEHHFGWYQSSSTGNQGLISGGSANSNISIRKDSYTEASVYSWQEGEVLKGILTTHGDTNVLVVWADMTLIARQSIPELPDIATQWKQNLILEKIRKARRDALLRKFRAKIVQIQATMYRKKMSGADFSRLQYHRRLSALRKEIRKLRID